MVRPQKNRTDTLPIGHTGGSLPHSLRARRDAILHYHAGLRTGRKGGDFCLDYLIPAEARARRATRGGSRIEWRGQRTAARLHALRVCLDGPGLIVGRPAFEATLPANRDALARAYDELSDLPPWPGGDPGHLTPDYETLLTEGIDGLRVRVAQAACANGSPDNQAFYRACAASVDGFAAYVQRTADACRRKARKSGGTHWAAMDTLCTALSHRPPQTFHEALQLMFFAIVALWFGEGNVLVTPGRMDQILGPFYAGDRATGVINTDRAFELLCAFFLELNLLLGPGTALSVLVGGRNRRGTDASNELTWLCLAARAATGLCYPNIGLAVHAATPPALLEYAAGLIGEGRADPAIFNDEVIVEGLRELGVSDFDSYGYMNSTCSEIKLAGCSHIWVGQPAYNCALPLLAAVRARSQARDGGGTCTYDDFEADVLARLDMSIAETAEAIELQWQARPAALGRPLASCLTADCLQRGRDIDDGGARYEWTECTFVGFATLVDSLSAVRHAVFETGNVDFPQLLASLEEGLHAEPALVRHLPAEAPRYGEDDPQSNATARRVMAAIVDSTRRRRINGHPYLPGFFAWNRHVELGSATGATPDGRPAGAPLSAGLGPAAGRDTRGPTASMCAGTSFTHQPLLGGVVFNLRLSRAAMRDDERLAILAALIRGYLSRGGAQIQINVVDNTVLRAAREHPDDYADLLVRVAGFSDYFVNLSRGCQDEIIARTAH